MPCVCDCSFPGHVHLFYGLFDLILYIPVNIVFPGHVHLFFGTTEVNYKCTKICLFALMLYAPLKDLSCVKVFGFVCFFSPSQQLWSCQDSQFT